MSKISTCINTEHSSKIGKLFLSSLNSGNFPVYVTVVHQRDDVVGIHKNNYLAKKE